MIFGALKDAFQRVSRADFWFGVLAFAIAGLSLGIIIVIYLIMAGGLTPGLSFPALFARAFTGFWLPVTLIFILIMLAVGSYMQAMFMATGLRLANDERVRVGTALADGGRFYGRGAMVAGLVLLGGIMIAVIAGLVAYLVYAKIMAAAVVVGIIGLVGLVFIWVAMFFAQLSAFYFPRLGFGSLIIRGFRLARQRFWMTLGFLLVLGLLGGILVFILLFLSRHIPVVGPLLNLIVGNLALPLFTVVAQFSFFKRCGAGDGDGNGREHVKVALNAG